MTESALPAQRTILLRHFVVGFCIEEHELTELRGGQDQAQRDELKTAADPARFPLTAQALPGMLNTAAEDRFELGVHLMLSGIAGTPAVSKSMVTVRRPDESNQPADQ